MLGNIRSKNKHLRLGLSIDRDDLYLLLLDLKESQQPQLKDLVHVSLLDIKKKGEIEKIKQILRKNKFHKIPCYGLIQEANYQLLLVEPINVPEEELAEAMLWKIRDIAGVDIENTVVDTFHQPDKKMLYTVAAQKDRIKTMTSLVHQLGLSLVSLDIEELAYRNFIDLYPESEQGIALVLLKQGEGKILIFRQGNLFLCRRFSLNYQPHHMSADPSGHKNSSPNQSGSLPEEDIVLEIQRSVDYYERQMGQVAPTKIIFSGISSEDEITKVTRNSFQQKIACLDLENLIDHHEVDSIEKNSLWTNERLALLTGVSLRQEFA
jgi:MSHA biogenesis protein MshI